AEGLRMTLELGPDLIVCDVMMPELSGADLVRAVRSDKDIATTPILVISARAGDDARVRLLEAGANDYVAKPFSLHELRVRADNLVKTGQLEAQLRAARMLTDRERIARNLRERVIGELLRLSMTLGAVRSITPGPAGERIDEAMTTMDEIIREIRATVFDAQTRPARRPLRPKYRLILEQCEPGDA
ncbi:MAG: response regulator, partial [Trebonia sp.]